MKPPRALADLPFAAELRPFDGEFELEDDYDRVRFDGAAFTEAVAGGSRFAESATYRKPDPTMTSLPFVGAFKTRTL